MRKNKFSRIKKHTDTRLAAAHPTANSAEFVPLSEKADAEFASENSLDIFDFIPEIKDDKFNM